MSSDRTLLALAAVLVGAAFLTRRAQAAGSAGSGDLLEEITVTARRLGTPGFTLDDLLRLEQPRGIRNHNPMNVRKTAIDWQGEILGLDAEYETFATAADGIRAGSRVLLNYKRIHRLDTIAGIIGRWAPTTENPTAAYIAYVSNQVQTGSQVRVDLEDFEFLIKVVTAIIKFENDGLQPYTAETIRNAVRAAF